MGQVMALPKADIQGKRGGSMWLNMQDWTYLSSIQRVACSVICPMYYCGVQSVITPQLIVHTGQTGQPSPVMSLPTKYATSTWGHRYDEWQGRSLRQEQHRCSHCAWIWIMQATRICEYTDTSPERKPLPVAWRFGSLSFLAGTIEMQAEEYG